MRKSATRSSLYPLEVRKHWLSSHTVLSRSAHNIPNPTLLSLVLNSVLLFPNVWSFQPKEVLGPTSLNATARLLRNTHQLICESNLVVCRLSCRWRLVQVLIISHSALFTQTLSYRTQGLFAECTLFELGIGSNFLEDNYGLWQIC